MTTEHTSYAGNSQQYVIPEQSRTAQRIAVECDAIKDMLIAKNNAYGDSALNPLRLLSKASAEEQLLVRIDDKLSRIARGHEYVDDDTVLDLIGYLVLLRVSRGGADE